MVAVSKAKNGDNNVRLAEAVVSSRTSRNKRRMLFHFQGLNKNLTLLGIL
jgi:hypothetical protein